MGVLSPKAKLVVRLDGHIENIATNIYGEPTIVCGTEHSIGSSLGPLLVNRPEINCTRRRFSSILTSLMRGSSGSVSKDPWPRRWGGVA